MMRGKLVRNAMKDGSIEQVIIDMLAGAKDRIVSMDPETARRVLMEANFPDQRGIKNVRVEKHQHRIVDDWFSAFPITIAWLPDGRMWLIDGQNRLEAIARHGSPVAIRIELNEVTEDEARRMYAYFDERDSVRSEAEVLDAMRVGANSDVKKVIRGRAYAALLLINNGFQTLRHTGNVATPVMDERMYQFDEWLPQIEEWQKVYMACQSDLKGKFRTVSVTAVGIYTLRYQPEKAAEFWYGTALNDKLSNTDPRAALIRDFSIRKTNSGSTKQAVQAPAVAWNAFYARRRLQQIKCVDGARIVIKGTPFA